MGINKIGIKFGVLLILVALATVAGELRAAPLNLAVGSPNITSAFITTDYNAGAQLLTASGFAMQLNPGANNIAGGTFDINAAIDNAGNASGGSLSIGGTIAALGFNSGTLLTGTLSAFGFPGGGAPGDPLEFLFNVTGGDAAGLYGATAGVILSSSGFIGNFLQNFSSGAFQSVSDTFAVATAVPEPSSLSLFLLGLVFCGVVLSWHRRSAIAID